MSNATMERPVVRSAPPQAGRPSRRRRGWTRNLRLLVVDVGFLVAFLLVIDVPLTGLPVHEWAGIVVGVLTVVHTVQHVDWIRRISDRLFERTGLVNRINWVLMVLLWTSFVTAVVSGLVVSEVIVPALGLGTASSPWWLWLHVSSASLAITLTAWHLAMNWRWIVSTVTRHTQRTTRKVTR